MPSGSAGGGPGSVAGPSAWAPGYREFAPPAHLAAAVHCLWISVMPPAPADSRLEMVLPDACTDLIWQAGAGVFVAGPDTRPAPFGRQPGAVLAGVRFRPGAGGAALGMPLSELLDQRVDAGDLPAVPAGRLPADLPPPEAMRRLARIAAELAAQRPGDGVVLAAAALLDRPGARAGQVARTLEISGRQLRRRCLDGAGHGPAMLARVLRFRRFLSRVDAGDAADLAGLAADAGYADQPHLTRDSTQLAGMAPAALARVRGPAASGR